MLKRALIILAVLIGLVVAGLLLLPRLIDVNRYRGLIQEQAGAALGREVTLGTMHLSLLPIFGVRVDDVTVAALPEEGPGTLLTARALRVGARLGPLLRKRLEVTSIVLEQPRLTLVRNADGVWNVQRLLASAESPAAADAPPAGPAFRIDRLELTEGEIRIRDLYRRSQPLELTLAGVDVELRDFAPDRLFDYSVELSVAELPGSRVRLSGTAGPLASTAEAPLRIVTDLDVQNLDPTQLAALAHMPQSLFGSLPASLAGHLEADFTTPARYVLSGIRLKGLALALRRDAQGRWNLPEFGENAGGERASAADFEVSDLRVDDSRIELRDETADPGPLVVTLSSIRLRLDRLPTQGAARVDLGATLESASGNGALEIQGQLGRLSAENFPAVLTLRAPTLPLSLLRPLLGRDSGIDTEHGFAGLDLSLNGDLYGRFDAAGTLGLRGVQVRFDRPDGEATAVPLELDATFDTAVAGSGAEIEARKLEIAVRGQRLALRGKIRQEGNAQQIDVQLLPARMPADDLAALLALALGDLPVAFSSTTPVELEGRVVGRLGPNSTPAIEGQAKLRDFTFRHPSMSQPIEQTRADISLRGETLEISGLAGVVGASDVAGQLRVEGFSRPRVSFELRSKKADLGELFSFLTPEETPSTAPASAEDPLADLTLQGSLNIEQGSFGTLDFSALETTMRWADGVITLDPLRTQLYQGRYEGRVSGDLREAQPLWAVDGRATDVDVQAFLADNVAAPDLLSGRFTGEVSTTTRGSDYETILRGLSGGGTVRVEQGHVGKLDVLKTLAQVSGVFGETTIKGLSRQLATEGTEFTRLSGGLGLQDGAMKITNLLLDSPTFQLTGEGRLELLSTLFDGRFRLLLAPAISAQMREEGSRAADLFWNSRTAQVELPFGLAGPFDAPAPSIDFESVARAKVKDRAEDKLRDLVGSKLGSGGEQPAAAMPPAATVAPGAAAPARGSGSAITRTSWSSSLLAPDLRIEGVVRGPDVGGAALKVIDARGAEVQRIDPLPELRAWLESRTDAAQPAEVRFGAAIDGKRLALAKYPLRVLLVVRAGGGESEVAVEVPKR